VKQQKGQRVKKNAVFVGQKEEEVLNSGTTPGRNREGRRVEKRSYVSGKGKRRAVFLPWARGGGDGKELESDKQGSQGMRWEKIRGSSKFLTQSGGWGKEGGRIS